MWRKDVLLHFCNTLELTNEIHLNSYALLTLSTFCNWMCFMIHDKMAEKHKTTDIICSVVCSWGSWVILRLGPIWGGVAYLFPMLPLIVKLIYFNRDHIIQSEKGQWIEKHLQAWLIQTLMFLSCQMSIFWKHYANKSPSFQLHPTSSLPHHFKCHNNT